MVLFVVEYVSKMKMRLQVQFPKPRGPNASYHTRSMAEGMAALVSCWSVEPFEHLMQPVKSLDTFLIKLTQILQREADFSVCKCFDSRTDYWAKPATIPLLQ